MFVRGLSVLGIILAAACSDGAPQTNANTETENEIQAVTGVIAQTSAARGGMTPRRETAHLGLNAARSLAFEESVAAGAPTLLERTPLGESGFSTRGEPMIADNIAIVQERHRKSIMAIDLAARKTLWDVAAQNLIDGEVSTARISDAGTTIGGGKLFYSVLYQGPPNYSYETDGVVAVDLRTHDQLWKRDLESEGAFRLETPMLYTDDALYVAANGNRPVTGLATRLYALDPQTGATKWSIDAKGALSAPASTGDLVVFSDEKRLYAVDAENGDIVWTQVGTRSTGPVVIGEAVYWMSKELGGMGAFEAGTGAAKWTVKLKYFDTPIGVGRDVYIVQPVSNDWSYAAVRKLDPNTGAVLWTRNFEDMSCRRVDAAGNFIYRRHKGPSADFTALSADNLETELFNVGARSEDMFAGCPALYRGRLYGYAEMSGAASLIAYGWE